MWNCHYSFLTVACPSYNCCNAFSHSNATFDVIFKEVSKQCSAVEKLKSGLPKFDEGIQECEVFLVLFDLLVLPTSRGNTFCNFLFEEKNIRHWTANHSSGEWNNQGPNWSRVLENRTERHFWRTSRKEEDSKRQTGILQRTFSLSFFMKDNDAVLVCCVQS